MISGLGVIKNGRVSSTKGSNRLRTIGAEFPGAHAAPRWQDGQVASQTSVYVFEQPTQLVTGDTFRYLRHPMYASLLTVAQGAHFHTPNADRCRTRMFIPFLL